MQCIPFGGDHHTRRQLHSCWSRTLSMVHVSKALDKRVLSHIRFPAGAPVAFDHVCFDPTKVLELLQKFEKKKFLPAAACIAKSKAYFLT